MPVDDLPDRRKFAVDDALDILKESYNLPLRSLRQVCHTYLLYCEVRLCSNDECVILDQIDKIKFAKVLKLKL